MISKDQPNAKLVEAAIRVRKNGYRSYGEMQASEYASMCSSDMRPTESERRKNGYMTVRERMLMKEKNV